jgi:hypothetical protein
MAYGCQASLEHALAKIERISEKLHGALVDPQASEERKLLTELLIATGYVADAVRYLKDGVP